MNTQFLTHNVATYALAIGLSAGCGSSPPPTIRSGFRVTERCQDVSHPGDFLPAEYLGAPTEFGSQVSERLSQYLRSSSDSPFWCGDARDAYRALLVPSNRSAQLIALVRNDAGWVAKGTRFVDPRESNADSPPAVPAQSFESKPSNQEITQVLKSIEEGTLWTVPAFQHSIETYDGSWVVLELREQGNYRVIVRGKVSDLAVEKTVRLMMDIAGMQASGSALRRPSPTRRGTASHAPR